MPGFQADMTVDDDMRVGTFQVPLQADPLVQCLLQSAGNFTITPSAWGVSLPLSGLFL